MFKKVRRSPYTLSFNFDCYSANNHRFIVNPLIHSNKNLNVEKLSCDNLFKLFLVYLLLTSLNIHQVDMVK